jgi:hypothetical protein
MADYKTMALNSSSSYSYLHMTDGSSGFSLSRRLRLPKHLSAEGL